MGEFKEKYRCMICQGDAEAWHPSYELPKTILVCRKCALEILPGLIANACWDHTTCLWEMDFKAETILKNYWREVAHKMARTKDIVSERFD